MNTGATPTISIAGAVKRGSIYFIISTKNCFGLALFRKTQIKTSLDGVGGGNQHILLPRNTNTNVSFNGYTINLISSLVLGDNFYAFLGHNHVPCLGADSNLIAR